MKNLIIDEIVNLIVMLDFSLLVFLCEKIDEI